MITKQQSAKDANLSAKRRELAAGVFKQAAQDLRRFHRASNRVERELYYDAYSWVMSEDDLWPFSFLNVCDALNLAPESVRGELMSDQSSGTFLYFTRRCVRAANRCGLSFGRFFGTESITEPSDHLLSNPTPTNAL